MLTILKRSTCIYHEDAVLDYPQSGERTRGRRNIQNQRASQPSKKRFFVRRIIGGGDLWITEFILTYDGKPSYTVSIMEFRGDKALLPWFNCSRRCTWALLWRRDGKLDC
jgi:hypothetical protein